FPRNLVQAEAFEKLTAPYGGVSVTPLVSIEDDVAIERITGRRTCRTCGAVYHIKFNPPKQADICDNDGGPLYQRDDDKAETVRNRLYVYYKQTAPLVGYYFAKALLVELDGARPISEVHEELLSLLA
ncbi:MAG: nucleoside monophosphate kinase, partial [Caldilineaceae bacterium]|nr:nucleoside monophosphate kinase [Caldilineaceae bacterium]